MLPHSHPERTQRKQKKNDNGGHQWRKQKMAESKEKQQVVEEFMDALAKLFSAGISEQPHRSQSPCAKDWKRAM